MAVSEESLKTLRAELREWFVEQLSLQRDETETRLREHRQDRQSQLKIFDDRFSAYLIESASTQTATRLELKALCERQHRTEILARNLQRAAWAILLLLIGNLIRLTIGIH